MKNSYHIRNLTTVTTSSCSDKTNHHSHNSYNQQQLKKCFSQTNTNIHTNHQSLNIQSKLDKLRQGSPLSNMKPYLSSVDNLMRTLRRNVFISNLKSQPKKEKFLSKSPRLMINPNISEDVKNKFTSLIMETLSNQNNNNNLKIYDKNINNSEQNNKLINKKQALFQLITDNQEELQCASTKEFNKKLREFSERKRNRLVTSCKMDSAKREIERLLKNNISIENKKNALKKNHTKKQKYFAFNNNISRNIESLTQRSYQKY